MSDCSFVFTVEHASKDVPKGFCVPLRGQEHTLFDRGAKSYAEKLSRVLRGKLFLGKYSRLLVDLNRSPFNQRICGSCCDAQNIMDRYYCPFRNRVLEYISGEISQGKKVVHISCHTFTGTFFGVERDMDMGILYDPHRKKEKEIARFIQQEMKKNTSARVRLNAPYRGVSDGHTTALRKKLPIGKYVGIELEVNQKLFNKENLPLWNYVWFPELIEILLRVRETVCR